MYSVLNSLSEYTYFYISKTITSYTFLPVLKMVESLQRILKIKQNWLKGFKRPKVSCLLKDRLLCLIKTDSETFLTCFLQR